MGRRAMIVVALLVGLLALAPIPFASAKRPTNPNGWGTVSSQFATINGGLGEHASQQEEPRQGVGNEARNDPQPGDHVSDHGCFAGNFDMTDAIDCNGEPGNAR